MTNGDARTLEEMIADPKASPEKRKQCARRLIQWYRMRLERLAELRPGAVLPTAQSLCGGPREHFASLVREMIKLSGGDYTKLVETLETWVDEMYPEAGIQ